MMDISTPVTLHLPKRIEIGNGAAARLSEWAARYRQILVLATNTTSRMVDRLGLPGQITIHTPVPAEPKDTDLEAALAVAREVKPDLVVGFGGGSVMDIAKLVTVLWDSDQKPADVGGPNKVRQKCSDLAQVATTAGTGSEAGIRALFTSSDTGMKVAVESALTIADVAILDPDLTMTVPADTTAATGVDALAHCVEAYTSLKAHPLVDDYARLGMKLTGRFLKRAVMDGSDAEARAGMLLASFYGGLCLGPVNTAAGHAVAYPLGTHAGLPHGLANALVFPHVLAFNALECPGKTADILSDIGLTASQDPAEVLASADGFCRSLGIDMSLAAHGIREADLPAFAVEAHGIRRLMDNNPRQMSASDVEGIYRAAY